MLERDASGSPRIDEAATMKSDAAPGGTLGGTSTQRGTTEKATRWYPLEFLIPLIAKARPRNPP